MENLVKAIAELTALAPELVSKNLSTPKDTAHGDISFPCFLLAKNWQLNPAECATRLHSLFASLPSGISKVEIVGPYLNFFLDRQAHAQNVIGQILEKTFQVGKADHSTENIIIEYQSANIAKPFHVGHLRGTVIGHALDKILRHRGYNVLSMNHLGDWGTQFGFVWVGCQIWGKPENADLEEIVDLYRKASALRKRQEEDKLEPEDAGRPKFKRNGARIFPKA